MMRAVSVENVHAVSQKRARPLLSLLLACGLFGSLTVNSAHAGILDDDEARKAILDLRSKVDSSYVELSNRIDKLDAASRNQLELSNQIEMLKSDIAKLRGQNESLLNELANQQKRQKDFYVDLDNRLRKLEPQQLTVDGKTAVVDKDETRTFDAALAVFKTSDFKGAIAAFSAFLKQYPDSAYAPAAQYWIGTSYYAQRDYKSAIAAQQLVLKTWPDSPRAADAILNIASAEQDMGDKRAAKRTLESLMVQYPDSQAAKVAKDRLAGH